MIWHVTPARATGASSNPHTATPIRTRIVCRTKDTSLGHKLGVKRQQDPDHPGNLSQIPPVVGIQLRFRKNNRKALFTA